MTHAASHITDSLQLTADGMVELFELYPTTGGVVYFKFDNSYTWLGNLYTGFPMQFTGLKQSAENAVQQPRLTIGDENHDLSILKPFLFDGETDGAELVYRRVLLAHLTTNTNISEDQHFRVKRPESYSRTRISLALTSSSDSNNFTLPHLQYFPPAFPAVMLDV